MISTQAAYGAGVLAQTANQPTIPDPGLAYGAITPLDYSFMSAATRAPILPAQAPVAVDQSMPQFTPLSMPSVVRTATTVIPPSNGLHPGDLLHPLPSIVNTAPVQMQSPCANTFEQWVTDNPMLALLGLGALAYFTLGRKR
jgi:hypothetical protein